MLCDYASGGVVLHVGGNYNRNQNNGLFYLNGNNGASNANSNIGSRLLLSINPQAYILRSILTI